MVGQDPFYKDFMHPAFIKAIEEISTNSKDAQAIWMKTTDSELRKMLDLISIYVGKGEFEIPKNGKFNYGLDHYSIDHFYKD